MAGAPSSRYGTSLAARLVKHHRSYVQLSMILASLSIMGAKLRAPCHLFGPLQCYRIEEFKWDLNWDPSLSDSDCRFFQFVLVMVMDQ